MNQTEAIQLLEEALARIKHPQPNYNGGDMQVGGAYWRVMKVTHDFLIPQLAAQEWPEHAARLISMHQPTPAPQKAEKMLRLPDVELATGCKGGRPVEQRVRQPVNEEETMEPYWTDGTVTLYHGDTLELLPQMPKADAVITDPPYGETSLEWDKWPDG